MDQKYFLQPFGFAGDQTVIPDPLQSGGQVSFNQGWTFDYQRDQTTDPAAKPIDRATMNYLMFVVTQQLAQYQQHSMPEWITAANNNGSPFPYAKHSIVRYSATIPGVTFETYVSLIDANTDTPGATANWQLVSDFVATSAQITAGTDNRAIVTPFALAGQVALRALLAGSSSQVFNVATATAGTHAVPLAQMLALGINASAIVPLSATTTLTAAQASGALVTLVGSGVFTVTMPLLSAMQTGRGVKFVNYGTASVTITRQGSDLFQNGTTFPGNFALAPGDSLEVFAGTNWEVTGGSVSLASAPALTGRLISIQIITSSGTYTPTAGMKTCFIEGQGSGGQGGGSAATGAGQVSLGGGGASGSHSKGWYTAAVIGSSQAVTIGAGGTGAAAGATGTAGGASSLGAIMVLPGGPGGTPGTASSASATFTPGASAGAPGTGGNVLNTNGINGGAGFALGSNSLSGAGAGSPYNGGGGGGSSAGVGNPGNAGISPGAGGSGAASSVSDIARAGGAGVGGVFVIQEFA